MSYYQPKTGARCTCKRGIERDNCPQCEGTGWVIDFRAIRAATCTRLGHHVHTSGVCLRCGVRP